MKIRSVLLLGVFASLLVLWITPVHAEDGLERFIDGVMGRAIVQGETIGATVSVVQDGRLVMAKGYGQSARSRSLMVDGRSTQFQIGSITKVLVWISVLQQVEAGRLDLDEDVNRYLVGFKIAETLPEPITLRHLMTHTAGFEDRLVNLFAAGPRRLGDLASVLQRDQPARVRLPGTLVSYSNYGAALAAHVVSVVTQTPWDDYVEENIFKPLAMASATTRQPLPEDVEASRSRAYLAVDDVFTEKGFTYVPLGPAGSATATSLDLARLMVELLNEKGTGVLSAESKALLLGGAYLVDPLVNGMTLGLYEMTEGASARAVGHSGNVLWFHSKMILWPDENVGMFVSTNTSSGAAVVDALTTAVSEEIGFRETNDTWLAFKDDMTIYAGDYISARRPFSDYTKAIGLANAPRFSIDLDREELVASSGRRYKLLAQDVFQRVNGTERLVFRRDGDDVVGFSTSSAPTNSYTRAKLEDTQLFNLAIILAWAGLFVLAIVTWPISTFARRRDRHPAGQRIASMLVLVSGLIAVYFFYQLAQVLTGPVEEFVIAGIEMVPALLWAPTAFIALLGVQLVYLYRAWVVGFWWLSRRLHYTLLFFAQVGLAWAFWHWNLISPQVLSYLK